MSETTTATPPVTETDTSNPKDHKRQQTDAEGEDEPNTPPSQAAKKQRTDTPANTEEEEQQQQETAKDKDKQNNDAAAAAAATVTPRSAEIEIEADAAEDKGSRHSMEDAWVVLPDATFEDLPANLRCAHFAIYDGHGGRLAAEYAQKHLHRNVVLAGLPRELLDVKVAKKAILDGFRKTDESILQESASGGWQDGATAVCVWVLGQKVFIANIGDAKAVLARSPAADGLQSHTDEVSPLKAIVLTREHKAIYPQERARILKAGGTIGANGRLQGRLEVSRAFGDRQFKKVFGPSDAVEFVQKLLKEGLTATAVSRRLVREAVRERRCKDNCTAIVIIFRQK